MNLKLPQLGKKGASINYLAAIIITLIGFSVIALGLRTFMANVESKDVEFLCQNTIALRSKTLLNVEVGGSSVAGINLAPALCKTVDKEVKTGGDKEEILQKFADAATRCWWMLGQGKHEELFADNLERGAQALGFDKTSNDCFICYTLFTQDRAFEGDDEIPVTELFDYMATTQYPRAKEGVTYLDYIQSSGGPGTLISAVNGQAATVEDWDATIRPRRAYAVTYVSKNQPSEEGVYWGIAKIVGSTSLGAGGAVATGWVLGALSLSNPVGWAGLATVGLSSLVIGGTYSGLNDIKTDLYSERDYSAIYIDDFESAQRYCSTDLTEAFEGRGLSQATS